MSVTFFNESWFWSGFFAVAGSLGAIFIAEWFGRRRALQIERLKSYESEILAAHKTLYNFVSAMVKQFAPPEDPRRDFVALMKSDFYTRVHPNMLLFSPEIRRILSEFDVQYHCLGDPDLSPTVPFEKFISSNNIHKTLRRLES